MKREKAQRPSLLAYEIHHGPVHAVAPDLLIDMCKIVEHEKAAWPELRRAGARISQGRLVGMIGVDIDPVEMLVGKRGDDLVGQARDAA